MNTHTDSLDSTSVDVPVWVNGVQRWVTGLTKRTTCDDIIYALLYHDNKHEADGTENFAIFERWREVERPLQDRTKLLKVWNAWGAEQCNVQLDMRKLEDYFLPGELSRSKRRHRKSKHRSRHAPRNRCCSHDNCYDSGQMKCLEGVVKLVITQERKIHDIKERIEETDQLIDNLETKRHFNRIDENGVDYVQNAYLDSTSDDSSVDGCLLNIRPDEMEEFFAFCDRIFEMEEKIQNERNTISNLTLKIQQVALPDVHRAFPPDMNRVFPLDVHRVYSSNHGVPDCVTDVVSSEESERCEQIQVDINRIVAANVMQRYKEEGIKKELEYCDQQVSVKYQILKSLKMELESLDVSLPVCDERRPMDNCVGSQDLESDDRVGQLHVHDQYPKNRTKSVTFDDTLNHMHVIGTSKENVSENNQNTQCHVSRVLNDISLKPRPPETEKGGHNQVKQNQLRVTSILKNREIVNQRQSRNDSLYINSDMYRGVSIYDNHYKTNLPFLPSTMYTYANDGHYSILERTCKQLRDDNDSDTGLSSMHSDESPALETLV